MRIKTETGKYQIGDVFNEKTITSFGKSWKAKVAGNNHFCGQMWEECACGTEPVYQPSMKCEKCINRIFGSEEKEYCYAYFE